MRRYDKGDYKDDTVVDGSHRQGTVIVDGNGRGIAANQLSRPIDLFFDRHGHLYVSDLWDDRV